MKSRTLRFISALTLCAALAATVRLTAQEQKEEQPQQYTVIDLGTLGGTFGAAFGVSDERLVNGNSTLPGDTALHGFLWRNGVTTDLGTLGGPNSSASFPLNDRGEVAGASETSTSDPLGEDFCGFRTHLICLAFLWQDGVMTPLPTLGGNNGTAFEINNRGQAAGEAENTTADPTCVAPQVLQFKPVILEKDDIQELPTFPGDSDGIAFAINDKGRVVGISGNCATPSFHALLWHRRDEVGSQDEDDRDHWTVTDLGNLGGTMGNFPQDINNQGQVVGFSDLPGDTTQHAFLWTQDNGIQDLGTLPGDLNSFGYGINSEGQVVGTSLAASSAPRAFLRQSGVMTDLNTLIPSGSPLILLDAFAINSRGEIVGDALQTSTGDVHAYLAIPSCDEDDCEAASPAAQVGGNPTPKFVVPENVRKLLRQRLGLRYHIPGPGTGPTK